MSAMARTMPRDKLTPLQRAIYEVDQQGVNLRDSMRAVTQRVGFFVGQERYLKEREKIAAVLEEFGELALPVANPTAHPAGATHSAGSTGA